MSASKRERLDDRGWAARVNEWAARLDAHDQHPWGSTLTYIDHEFPLEERLARAPDPVLSPAERFYLAWIKNQFEHLKPVTLETFQGYRGGPEPPFEVAWVTKEDPRELRAGEGIHFRRGANAREMMEMNMRAICTMYNALLYGQEVATGLAQPAPPAPRLREAVDLIGVFDSETTDTGGHALAFTIPHTAAFATGRDVPLIYFRAEGLASSSAAYVHETALHELAHHIVNIVVSDPGYGQDEGGHTPLWVAVCHLLGCTGQQKTTRMLLTAGNVQSMDVAIAIECENENVNDRCVGAYTVPDAMRNFVLTKKSPRSTLCMPHEKPLRATHGSFADVLRVARKKYDMYACPRCLRDGGPGICFYEKSGAGPRPPLPNSAVCIYHRNVYFERADLPETTEWA